MTTPITATFPALNFPKEVDYPTQEDWAAFSAAAELNYGILSGAWSDKSEEFKEQTNNLALEIQAIGENAINAITLDTVDDLATYTGTGLVMVKDLNRGGTFIYDATQSAVNNGGTVFDGWVRQYSGAVNFKWFGAVDYRVDPSFDNSSILNTLAVTFKTVKLDDNTVYRIKEPILNKTKFVLLGGSPVNLQSKHSSLSSATILCDKEFVKYDSESIPATNTFENIVISSVSYYESKLSSGYSAIHVIDTGYSYNNYNGIYVLGFKESINVTGFGWFNYINDSIMHCLDSSAVLINKGNGPSSHNGLYNILFFTNCIFGMNEDSTASLSSCIELGSGVAGYGMNIDKCEFEGPERILKNNSLAMKVNVTNSYGDGQVSTDITAFTSYTDCSFEILDSSEEYFLRQVGGLISPGRARATRCVFRPSLYSTILPAPAEQLFMCFKQPISSAQMIPYTNHVNNLETSGYASLKALAPITSSAGAGLKYTMLNTSGVVADAGGMVMYREPNTNYTQVYISTRDVNGVVGIRTWTTEQEFRPNSDGGHYNLGRAANRWNNIFAKNAVIQTSDDRDKTYRDITEAETLVAKELKGLMKSFKFNDAIEAKGENKARIHYGTSAQEVITVFEKYGLDATEYAMVCYDEWESEYETKLIKEAVLDREGNILEEEVTEQVLVREAGNRYGIRYEEFLCFIIGAL